MSKKRIVMRPHEEILQRVKDHGWDWFYGSTPKKVHNYLINPGKYLITSYCWLALPRRFVINVDECGVETPSTADGTFAISCKPLSWEDPHKWKSWLSYRSSDGIWLYDGHITNDKGTVVDIDDTTEYRTFKEAWEDFRLCSFNDRIEAEELMMNVWNEHRVSPFNLKPEPEAPKPEIFGAFS